MSHIADTFSNWKNSIRHKMKCIMDGTSRTMLSELEGQALQLWDIVGFNGLPRYARKRTSVPPMRHNEHEDNASAHDESTQSSPACYSGGGVGGGGGGGNGSGVHMHVKEELLSNDYAEEQLLEQQRYDNNHSAASQTGMFNGSQLIDQGSAAGGSIEVTAVGEDDEADEYDEEENSNPLQETRAPSPLHTMVKRRKGASGLRSFLHATHSNHQISCHPCSLLSPPVDHHYHRYVPVQRRNGTSTERTAAGASTTADHNNDRYGGPQLIAESISKLADNVGQMAESIRDIAAAFTTTTHAAFELIRRQSEIIQGLIEK